MLHEGLTASELLAERGLRLAVVNMPWLNRFDPEWLTGLVGGERVLVVEDHSPIGGLGDALRRSGVDVEVLGVDGWPACGTPTEALRHHGLDGASLAARVAAIIEAEAQR
jgi:transketolase